MNDTERDLKNAVQTAKSSFYQFKGKKKKQSRKEARKEARTSKKLKRNPQHIKQQQTEDKNTLSVDKSPKKRKKRKRKKKAVTEDEEDNLTYDRSAYEAANKIDEQLISSLGKKLGIKNKDDKLASKFKEDGMDYILEVCESFTGEDAKGYSSDEEYLANKSKKSKKLKSEIGQTDLDDKSIKDKLLFEDGVNECNESGFPGDEEEVTEEEDDEDVDEEEEENESEDVLDGIADNLDEDSDPDQDEFDGLEEVDGKDEDDSKDGDKSIIVEEVSKNKRASKYIPPALRNKSLPSVDKKQLDELRIRKKLKGLLNRLSEGTMIGVVSEIESMYMSNSRNFMNEVLCVLVSESCISTMLTPEKLVLQHMVIVAALHMVIGSEVGGYFLQTLTERFSRLHQEHPCFGEGKICNNVLLMLIGMYQLKVVDSLLVYDIIHVCLTSFNDRDVEFIFLILKLCGPELRKDDPCALKEVILEVQKKATHHAASEDKSYVNFMLDAINALKNNNTRKIPLYDSSIVDESRKLLKTVVQGKSKNTLDMQLKVSLKDMLNAEEKGRWWITGSAWSGRGPLENKQSDDQQTTSSEEAGFSAKVLTAAKKQHMNTTIRKQIFCVIVSSEDYTDAFEKLLKLNFTEKQFREVIHVLLDCSLQEKMYNPFYAHLATRLCDFNRSNQVTFQYALWDRFKSMNTLKKHNLHNLKQILAHMVASKSVSLSVLKIISFGALDQTSRKFFSSFFRTFLLEYPTNSIKIAFQRIASLPKLSLLRQGIKLFLQQHVISPVDDAPDDRVSAKKIKELMEIVDAALDGSEYVPL